MLLSDPSEEYVVSTTHLNTQFKKETNQTNQTFNNDLDRFRIQRVAELLQRGGRTTCEIAAAWLGQLQYFTQVFKKIHQQRTGTLCQKQLRTMTKRLLTSNLTPVDPT